MKRSTMISIRVSLEFLEQMECAVKEKKFGSVSEAIRSYAEMGQLTEKFKTTITEPDWLKSIEELKQSDGLFDWLKKLTPEQEDAIARAIELDKEQRLGQRYYR